VLQFDTETTRQLEIAYTGADVVKRRRASFDAVGPRPGEVILDIGCGNGLLTVELAKAVGPEGQVIGVDPSADMRDAADKRCRDIEWIDLRSGTSEALPLSDGEVDKAVAVQVFEYLPELMSSLEEARRVLKPGGRLTVADIHFDSWVWFSEHPERMTAMMKAWDAHLCLRNAPALLPYAVQETGFAIERVEAVTICDHDKKPDGLATMMVHLMKAFAVSQAAVSEETAEAWATEQEALARAGRFFFSISQFVISASKPRR